MKWVKLIAFLPFLLFLSGCWDQHELDELGIVMGIGIDENAQGQLVVSYQEVNPGEVRPGSGGGGGKQPSFTVLTSTGDNLMETTRKASRKTSRRLFFGHARILILGENLAKKGIYRALDMISRDPEVRSTIQVFVSRGVTPANILEAFSPIDKIPADEVASKLDITQHVWGHNVEQDINQVLQSVINEGGEALINGISLSGNVKLGTTQKNFEVGKPTRIIISGMGIFKNGKLNGWAYGNNAVGIVWMRNQIDSSIINLKCQKQNGAIAIEVVRNKTKLTAHFDGERPSVTVNLYPETNIAEVNCPIDLENRYVIFGLEKQINKTLKEEISESVHFVQKKNSDVIGFGELLYRTDPKKWHEIKGDWAKIFPNIPVEINVYSRIRRLGIRTSPFLFELKKGK